MATSNPSVLHAGTQLVSSKAAIASKTSKTYYHLIPGAKFILPTGLEIVFLGGVYITDDPAQIAELNAVVNVPGSMVHDNPDSIAAQVFDRAAALAAAEAARQ